MLRFIARLLITTILCQGIGWASDSHDEALFGHNTTSSYDFEIPADHDANYEACDHCCHGASHLTGLLAASSDMASNVIDYRSSKLETSYYSFLISPPTPPPNA